MKSFNKSGIYLLYSFFLLFIFELDRAKKLNFTFIGRTSMISLKFLKIFKTIYFKFTFVLISQLFLFFLLISQFQIMNTPRESKDHTKIARNFILLTLRSQKFYLIEKNKKISIK